jgi:hypothetical protein
VIILRHDNINQVAASTMYHPPPISHYTTQVVLLLDQCRTKLQRLLDEAPRRSRSLLKLNKCLASIDTLLLSYLQGAMEDDGTGTSSKEARSSPQALEILKESSHARASTNAKNALQNPQDPAHHSHEQRSPLFENHSTKTAVDTLLFRLIVALELLLVRIDDANYVILGRRTDSELAITTAAAPSLRILPTALLVLGLCTGVGYFSTMNRRTRPSLPGKRQWIWLGAKTAGVVWLSHRVMNSMARVWMRDKIIRSVNDLREWKSQWELIHRKTGFTTLALLRSTPSSNSSSIDRQSAEQTGIASLGLDDKSRTLIEHAMKHGRKTYFWRSTGEIRFLMLKRFMDVYYASVGTAITSKQTSALALPLVTGAAASFYSLTGVSQEALSNVVNDTSRDLIKHAW